MLCFIYEVLEVITKNNVIPLQLFVNGLECNYVNANSDTSLFSFLL